MFYLMIAFFLYILMTDDQVFPALMEVSLWQADDQGNVFWIHSSGGAVSDTLSLCSGSCVTELFDSIFVARKSPCLQYHIKRDAVRLGVGGSMRKICFSSQGCSGFCQKVADVQNGCVGYGAEASAEEAYEQAAQLVTGLGVDANSNKAGVNSASLGTWMGRVNCAWREWFVFRCSLSRRTELRNKPFLDSGRKSQWRRGFFCPDFGAILPISTRPTRVLVNIPPKDAGLLEDAYRFKIQSGRRGEAWPYGIGREEC